MFRIGILEYSDCEIMIILAFFLPNFRIYFIKISGLQECSYKLQKWFVLEIMFYHNDSTVLVVTALATNYRVAMLYTRASYTF